MKHATEWHGYNHRNVLFLVNPVSSKSFPAIRRLTHKKAPVVVTEALESLSTVLVHVSEVELLRCLASEGDPLIPCYFEGCTERFDLFL